MHLRWRPWCATSPIQFQGQFQFRLLECAADGGILSGAYQCCKKCTPFDAQLTRFYIRVIRVRDVKWSAWQQLNYLRWISQSVSPLIILSLAGRSDQKNRPMFTTISVIFCIRLHMIFYTKTNYDINWYLLNHNYFLITVKKIIFSKDEINCFSGFQYLLINTIPYMWCTPMKHGTSDMIR